MIQHGFASQLPFFVCVSDKIWNEDLTVIELQINDVAKKRDNVSSPICSNNRPSLATDLIPQLVIQMMVAI